MATFTLQKQFQDKFKQDGLEISQITNPGLYRGFFLYAELYYSVYTKYVNHITYLQVYVTTGSKKYLIFSTSFKNYIMPLLTILLVLIVAGVILWLVNTYIPMDRKIKNILNIVVVIIVVIWLLQAFGLLASLKSLKV
jgi:hypothetical protein